MKLYVFEACKDSMPRLFASVSTMRLTLTWEGWTEDTRHSRPECIPFFPAGYREYPTQGMGYAYLLEVEE